MGLEAEMGGVAEVMLAAVCFLRGTYGAEALLLLPPHLASDEVLYDLGSLCGRAHQLGRVALGFAG